MPRTRALFLLLVVLLLGAETRLSAQARPARVLGLEGAQRVAAAAEAEARRNGWNVAIAIVDASGGLILFHRLDGTQTASLEIALGKARTAAQFRRPTKALEDAIAGGRTALLALPAMPIEGGLPIVIEGEYVGGIGVSGVTSQQDAQIAEAGLAALRP